LKQASKWCHEGVPVKALRLGAAVLVGVVATAGLGGCARPWTDLRARYETTESAPASSRRGQSARLHPSRGLPKMYSYTGSVVYACDSQGVYVDLGGERGAVRVPVSAVGFCSRSTSESKRWTILWVPAAAVEVSLLDNDDAVVGWCREQKIEIVDRATAYRRKGEK